MTTSRKHLFSSESLDINVGAGSEINQDWRLQMALDMVHVSFYVIICGLFLTDVITVLSRLVKCWL